MTVGATCAGWAAAQPATATGELTCSATASGGQGYTKALHLHFAGHVANGVHETDLHHEFQELVVDADGSLRFSAAGVGKLDDSRWYIRASGMADGRSLSATGRMHDSARKVIRETCTVSLRASRDVRPPGADAGMSPSVEPVGAPLEFSASTLWGPRAFREWNFEHGMPWSLRDSPAWSPRPLDQRPLKWTERALASELRALVAELPIKAVVLVDGGQVAAAWARPGVTPATLLPGASMSKSVTALAAGQAICAGHLSLETRAADLVPALRGKPTGTATLRQLLLMSSGSAETLTQPASGITFREAEQYLQGESGSLQDLLADARLASAKPAGQVFDYKSYDPYLAAWMVERATGRRFTSWVRDSVFREAGLAHGYVLDTDRHGAFLATGGVRLALADWVRLGVYIQEQRDRGGCLGSFIRDMLSPVISVARTHGVNGHFNGYGYFTWTDAELAPEMGWMAGHFGQRIGISSRAGNTRIFLTFGDGTDPAMGRLYPLARRWVH